MDQDGDFDDEEEEYEEEEDNDFWTTDTDEVKSVNSSSYDTLDTLGLIPLEEMTFLTPDDDDEERL